MGYDINKIRKFNNEIKSLDDRREYIENLLEENVYMINEYNRDKVVGGEYTSENMALNKTIEEWGTYLLRSKDVNSCRSISDSFYESESSYRQYAIGKASITKDIVTDDEFMNYGSENEVSKEYDRYSLFNFDKMTIEEKKKLIKIGLKEKDNADCEIKNDFHSAYEYIIGCLSSDRDKDIVSLFASGYNESEIGEELGINRSSVNRRLAKIVSISI